MLSISAKKIILFYLYHLLLLVYLAINPEIHDTANGSNKL